MYGFAGFFDSPSPLSMIVFSWETVRWGPASARAGTSGETPPRPRSPWHLAQANWTKSWAPAATGSLTGRPRGGCGAGAVTVCVTVFVLPQPDTATSRNAATAKATAENVRLMAAGYAHRPPASPGGPRLGGACLESAFVAGRPANDEKARRWRAFPKLRGWWRLRRDDR